MTQSVGALVMAYGSPRDNAEVRDYFTHIRHGHAPTDDEVADLIARYDAIGGTFPLRAISEQQAAAISAHLDFPLALGYKHATPMIEDAVESLAESGVCRIVGLVLAPHYAQSSIGEYAGRAADAGRPRGIEAHVIESWHLLPAYVEFLAQAVLEAATADSTVVFTAHSLPADHADLVYEEQLRDTAAAVAERANISSWCTAFQSAGRRGEWLRPDVLSVMREQRASGVSSIVVCPCGFVTDHLEVRYDLDVAAAELAREQGVAFRRTKMVNDDPAVMKALAELIKQHAL